MASRWVFVCLLLVNWVLAEAVNAQGSDWAFYVSDSGDIGAGTDSPQAKFHVVDAVDAKLLVENSEVGDTGDKFMFELHNASRSKVRFAITSNGDNSWTFDNNPRKDWFSISKVGTGLNEFIVKSNGDGVYRGTVTAAGFNNVSSREAKTDFANIDALEMLSRVTVLPLSEWRYKTEGAGARHVGPMAEDFQQLFELGDGKTISTVDISGITLAAIQGLKQEKDAEIAELASEAAEKDREIADLQVQLQLQGDRMIQLEMALAEVLRNHSSGIQVGSAD